MKRLLTVLVAAMTLVTLGAGKALADGPIATTDGSSAQYLTSGNKFKNCDTDADGDWVYVKWHLSGSTNNTTYENHNGAGSCTYPPTGLPDGKTIVYKSCQNDAFSDTCSDWKSTTT